jgi:hypothetical protein
MVNTREDFKMMAAGQFTMMSIENTIDKANLKIFIEGALFAYDLIRKEKLPNNVKAFDFKSGRDNDFQR